MSLEKDIAIFLGKLDDAIKDTLEKDVADEIKDEMSKNIEQYEFTRSRGSNGFGVRDKRNYKEVVEGENGTYILQVRDEAPFQAYTRTDKSLAEVVEQGDERYHIYYARPFIAPTQMVMDYGVAEVTLADGLRKRGFVIV